MKKRPKQKKVNVGIILQELSQGLNTMVVNIVTVTKKAVILVFNPKINKMPPSASVNPADQAKNSGI